MALTTDPESGEPTTTFVLAHRERERARLAELARLDRELFEDAMRWRALPDAVKRRYAQEGIT